MREIHFTRKDFVLEWYSGSGAGGQHRNKHQNCCRITHPESGLVAVGTETRSRVQNQSLAFERLCAKLIAYYDVKSDKEINTSVIRNYHEPRNEVLDKASGKKLSYKDVVLSGNISEMVEARRMALMTEQIDLPD